MAKKVIEIIHRETIRPSSPTPHNLKFLKLSFLDQSMHDSLTPLVFFYPGDAYDQKKKSETLRKSLAKSLTQFYPLAGRLKGTSLIECGDQGAEYIEARIGYSLSDILRKPDDTVSLDQFLPAPIESLKSASTGGIGSLLLVQATFFDCGGLAIAMCFSHKIADGITIDNFIKFWCNTAIGSRVVNPVFMADSMFPPLDNDSFATESTRLMQMTKKYVTKRFVFDGSKIGALKEIAASTIVPKPTKNEVVSGLIWRALITVSKKLNSNSMAPSVWAFPVNLRPRFSCPVPENQLGNLVVMISTSKVEEEMEVKELVSVMRKGMQEFDEKSMKKIEGKDGNEAIFEFGKEFAENAMSDQLFLCSSLCGRGLYEADFGWGNPIWMSFVSTNIRNFCMFMDTKDRKGVEAWITLSEQEMFLFKSDKQLLQFAQLNPSVNPPVALSKL